MPLNPDRNLRRVVLRLAVLPSEDIEGILSEFDADARARVKALLSEFAAPIKSTATPASVSSCDASRLSPWIVDRLLPDSNVEIAEAVCAELHRCAATLFPAAAPVARRPRLFERMAIALAGQARQ
ncbi:MAG: hypothetical protein WDM89_06860 [Rhizomicrobium sp.]